MACERGKVFALLKEAEAIYQDRRTTLCFTLNGKKSYLDKIPDGATYQPKAVRYLVSQLRISPELAHKHFPELFCNPHAEPGTAAAC